MPGIYGALSRTGKPIELGLIDDLGRMLLHQTWYGSHKYSTAGLALGVLSTSPHFTTQFSFCETDGCVLIVDGYGIVVDDDIAHIDRPDFARDLVNMYEKYGADFVRRLKGSFNIAVYDKRAESLNIFNDRFGFSHLYYYVDDDVFLFGPEVKTFLAYPDFDKTLNPRAISFYLSSDCVFGNETFFDAVRMVPSASHIEVSGRDVNLSKYWRPTVATDRDKTKEQFVDRALDLYRQSLARKLPADSAAPVLFPLSGGLDSRLQIRLASETHSNLRPFTYGHRHCDDYKIARRVAATLDLERTHKFMRIEPDWLGTYAHRAVWLNDGQIDPFNVNFIAGADQLGAGPTTLVFGILGADFSLGAGSHYGLDQVKHIDDENYLRQNFMSSGYFPWSPGIMKTFMNDDVAVEFAQISSDYAWDCFQEYRVHDRFCDQKLLFYEFHWYRRKMAVLDALKYYFHCVLPLLDYDLFDLSLSIPPEWKIGNQLYIELYKRHFPELAAIPWTKTGRNLYASETQIQRTAKTRQAKRRLAYIVRRLSHGHINIRDNQAIAHWEPWLRTQPGVRDVVLPIVRSACDRVPDFFDGAKISRLLDEYDKGKYWHFPTIMRVFNFADWYALFVDDEYRELIS